ncbi:MAG: tetratricopeptide repeat protein [Microscillaceae bacterium]|jgi:serine phosphatase RsbU (regulator of sigma subunit)/tetratricopeptide (TPR) repeat protein|nr:tetratricopeptide repeat protein [Microscillaceae bacterium]
MLIQVGFCQDLNGLITRFTQADNTKEKNSLATQIALHYQQQNAHQKALEYFQQAYQLGEANEAAEKQIQNLENQAYSYIQLKDYFRAMELYKQVLDYQARNEQNEQALLTLDRLINLCGLVGQPPQALAYSMQAFEINRKIGNMIGITNSYNNIGFFYKEMGRQKEALDYYRKCLEISKLIDQFVSEDVKAILHQSIGTAYTAIEDFGNAQYNYEQALKIRQKQGKVAEIAESYNYLAVNHLLNRNNGDALEAAQQAIDYAETAKADDKLATSYRIIAEIYRKTDDLPEYQKYSTLFQKTRENLSKKIASEQEKIIQTQLDIEKRENELRMLISEKEKQKLELNQTQLEREKQAQALDIQTKELALLKSNQERQLIALKNQQLERERTEQILQITTQKAEAERQRQAIVLLEKNRELQALALAKRDADNKKREQDILLLEKDKKLQEQQLKDEARIRWYGIMLLASLAIGFVYIIITYLRDRRKSRLLQAQNIEIQHKAQEIQAQNELLQLNQEEIMAQRDQIAQKNADLSVRDRQITASINAAKTIQDAILPYKNKLDALLREYFVIFKPKDVVSGDFYWLNEIDDKIILAAVDCTGHGVPGAFMSLIGNTLLDKVVRVWKITDPAAILTRLHEDVQIMLNQNNYDAQLKRPPATTSDPPTTNIPQNNSGMDVAIIVMERNADDTFKITFSGARRPLYYVPANTNQVCTLEGDRKSIGGIQVESRKFTNQEINLSLGSLIYIGTDGYADQNDARRRRLGEDKLKKIISEVADLRLNNQAKYFEQTLAQQMTGTDQRDDILLIGFRLN